MVRVYTCLQMSAGLQKEQLEILSKEVLVSNCKIEHARPTATSPNLTPQCGLVRESSFILVGDVW